METEERVSKTLELTVEGSEMVENGSHEAKVFSFIGPNGIDQTELLVTISICLFNYEYVLISKILMKSFISVFMLLKIESTI